MIVDRLAEHLVALADRGPALADDVLVEVLARAEAEPEAPAGQDLHRRRLLRHHRRVVAQDRARHVGHEADALGRVGGRAEDRPRVARVPLLLEPRRVVVADHGEVEARAFGVLEVADKPVGPRLLAHHRVAEVRHAADVARGGGPGCTSWLSSARGTGRSSSARRPAAARTIAWTRNAAWNPSTAATAGAVPSATATPGLVRRDRDHDGDAEDRADLLARRQQRGGAAPVALAGPAGRRVDERHERQAEPERRHDQRRQQVRGVLARRLQPAHEPQPGAADDRPDEQQPARRAAVQRLRDDAARHRHDERERQVGGRRSPARPTPARSACRG